MLSGNEIRKLYLSFPDTSFKFKLRHSIHLVSSCILAGKPWKAIKDSTCKMITIMAIPCGVVLAIYVTAKGR